jgi:hypothetical protein
LPSAAVGEPCSEKQPVLQMFEEGGIGVELETVADPGVPGSSAGEGLTPSNRVVVSHPPAAVGPLVEGGDDPDPRSRIVAEVVELVRHPPLPFPAHGQFERDGAGLEAGRMALEVGADECAVPRPLMLRVSRRMEPEISASSCDVALESALLMLVQDVARGVGESDDTIASQLGAVEGCGVLGVVERARSAATAAGIESWRKPAVLVKTRTRSAGAAAGASATAVSRSVVASCASLIVIPAAGPAILLPVLSQGQVRASM